MVIYLDGASLKEMEDFYKEVSGFTTNPSLMKKAGIKDYRAFARDVLSIVKKKPVSFEVFSDQQKEMERQARIISEWGENVYVKIPVTHLNGESTVQVIERLHPLKLNITAVMTRAQVIKVCDVLRWDSIISIFCGRIADTGLDPEGLIWVAQNTRYRPVKILWASTREVYNIVQAEDAGCDIITVTADILKKRKLFGKSLKRYSLETVKQFYEDAKGLSL